MILKNPPCPSNPWVSTPVFENLISYIEKGDVWPLVAQTYPLKDIVAAQNDFLAKKFAGKLVLLPDG